MCIPNFVFGITLTLLLIVLPPGMSVSVGTSAKDFDYYNDEAFDPDWINSYDPFENPPCSDWNPVDGCGRTPARTKTPTTTPGTSEHTTPPLPAVFTTRVVSSHKLECTVEEIKIAACLHGGECFIVVYLDSRNPYCQCSEMWTGTRCEEMDENIFGNVLSADKVEKAGIAAGIVALIIIITVAIVYLVVKKRKQRKNRAEVNGSANGHAGKALMGCEKETMENEDAEKCTDV